MAAVRELVEYIAKALVDEPDQVRVSQAAGQDAGSQVVILSVSPNDRGKVIGKRGRTAHALRCLLHAAAGNRDSISLEIAD